MTDHTSDPNRTRATTLHGVHSVLEFPGTTRFDVQSCLGAGSFGTVYECYDREEHKSVAVKVLRCTDPPFLLRFKSEFRKVVGLRHPNLVELYELFSEGRFWFFTMELVHGVDFLRYVEHRARAQAARESVACNLNRLGTAALQLAQGIAALHDAGILHCDVKPANVLVSTDGHARLLDYGLVRDAGSQRAQTIIAGTPAYMSPEQGRGDGLSPATDWYSFGVVLFQSLTGVLPTQHNGWAASDRLLTVATAFARDVPDALTRLCEELLHQDPTRRPGASGVLKCLGGVAGATPAPARIAMTAEDALIGRQPHLAKLASLLEASKQGNAVVINMHGPSGIGKSALVRAFCRSVSLDETNALVLSGRCHESETVPFKALDEVIDGLSRYLNALSEIEAEALAPRDAQYLIRVFQVLGQVRAFTRNWRSAIQKADAQEVRERAFASLQDLLSRLSDYTTVVLALDDLQWGDLDSAAFLVRLLSARFPPSILLIASYRSEDARSSPFLQTWQTKLAAARSVAIHDLEIGDLSPAESRALARRLLAGSGTPGERRAESIAAESGGSPFLIDQLARYAETEVAGPEAPVSLRQAMANRIAGLPEDAHALLEVVALAGRPISPGTARVAAGANTTFPSIARLVTERLVRVRKTTGLRELEVYHDRIREAIVASMLPETRTQRHLMLARAWEREENIDPAVLAMHFKEGGDSAAAARWSLAAAEHAASALAFDRAAHFFQLALYQGSWDGEDRLALQRKLALALVDAGRGPQSAGVYLNAAGESDPATSLDLKRLAAEQLLRSGHTQQGQDLLRSIAQDLRIWWAERPWHAAVSLSWHGFRVALRRLRLREQAPPNAHDNAIIMVLDVYWSLGIGIGLVDVIRGWDFQARHLLLALQVGDPNRAAMSMAVNAAALCGSQGKDSRLSRALLARARELSDRSEHPQARGFVATMETLSALMRGDWLATAQLSETAACVLRDKCTGVSWERSFNSSLGHVAAILLGDWRKLADHAARVPELVEEAKARGDFHTLHYLLNGAHIGSLVVDQPDSSVTLFQEVFACLPNGGFYVPHLMALLSEADTALYEGNNASAWAVVNAAWPALSESLLLRVKHFFMLAVHLRARTALAAAVSSDSPGQLLDVARQSARQIGQRHAPWGDGLSLLIRASIADFEGDRAETLKSLQQAESQLDAVHQAHLAAACRYRRGKLIGGTEGQALVSRAEEWATSAGVINLSKIVDMLVPGPWRLDENRAGTGGRVDATRRH